VHTEKACVTGVQVHTAARQPSSSRVLYSSTAVLYSPFSRILTAVQHSICSSNEGAGAFMEEREIEGACMHPQFSSSLDAFYI
jgi:hypothetical protein